MKFRLFLLIMLTSSICYSQISILPPGVFIDKQRKTGSLTIKNSSDQVREVAIEFVYGYVAYDSLGNSKVEYNDSISENVHSLKPYIRVYPSKVLIPPFQEQKIRLMINMPPEIPDGMYWTRLVAKMEPIEQQLDTSGTGITTGLALSTSIVGVVIYTKGPNNSEIELSKNWVKSDEKAVNIYLNYTMIKPLPYFGQVFIKIFNKDGNLVDETMNQYCAVYKDGFQRFEFRKEKFKPGDYKAEVVITTEREDVPEQYRAKVSDIEKEFEFTVE